MSNPVAKLEKVCWSGTPTQIGRLNGAACAGKIEEPLRAAHAALQVDAASPQFSRAMQRYLETHFPEVAEELLGLADAAGLTYEEAFLLSAANSLRVLPAPHMCSAIAWRNSEGGTMLFKTDDVIGFDESESREIAVARQIANRAVFDWKSGDGYRNLVIGQLGRLWGETGVNEWGLCLGSTSGRPVLGPQEGAGIPQHIFPLLVLRYCADCDEVAEFARRHPVAGKGINLAVSDAGGRTLTVEKCGPHTGLYSSPGHTYAVNHYRDPAMAEATQRQVPEFFESDYYRNTKARADFLDRHLMALEESNSALDTVHTLLAAENCCIWQCGVGANALWTNYAALLESNSRTMALFTDSPLENSGATFSLNPTEIA